MCHTYRTPYLSSSSSVCYFHFIPNFYLDSKLSSLAPQPSHQPTLSPFTHSHPHHSSPSLPFLFPFPGQPLPKHPPTKFFFLKKKNPKHKWASSPPPPPPLNNNRHTRPPPPPPQTAAAASRPPTGPRARAAGGRGTTSSPAWSGTGSWTGSRRASGRRPCAGPRGGGSTAGARRVG